MVKPILTFAPSIAILMGMPYEPTIIAKVKQTLIRESNPHLVMEAKIYLLASKEWFHDV